MRPCVVCCSEHVLQQTKRQKNIINNLGIIIASSFQVNARLLFLLKTLGNLLFSNVFRGMIMEKWLKTC